MVVDTVQAEDWKLQEKSGGGEGEIYQGKQRVQEESSVRYHVREAPDHRESLESHHWSQDQTPINQMTGSRGPRQAFLY